PPRRLPGAGAPTGEPDATGRVRNGRTGRDGNHMTPIRVLLVDDQPMIRTGFQLILEAESDISVVGEAGYGAAAIQNARSLRPDIILMDIRMPRVDGIQATAKICAENPVSKIIILTTFDLDEYVVDALRAGASGFLVKDGPAQSLIEGI